MDKISAFMDGETASTEAKQTLQRLRSDENCQQTWNCFHLVGDVMRGEPVLRDDFIERLRKRIDEEPVVLAPRARWSGPTRMALSAAAAVAGVAIVLVIGLSGNPLRPQFDVAKRKSDPAQIAGQAPSITTAELRPQPPAAANPVQVNEYLMAHQEFSPRTALQGVVPYVRSVSEAHDGNRR